MATIEQAKEALRRADEAGNVEDAQRIAQALESQRSVIQESDPSAFEYAVGAGETALTLGSGAIAAPVAGIAGTGQAVYDLIRGEDDPMSDAATTIEDVQQRLTYQPRTQAGEEITGAAAKPFQAFEEMTSRAGGAVTDYTGSPALGAATKTAIEFSPSFLGFRRPGLAEKRADRQRVERQAREQGVDLGAKGQRQREQVGEAGERAAGGRQSRAEPMPEIQSVVKQARESARKNVDEMYERARAERAELPVPEAREFVSMADDALRNFDVETMPIVKRRLDELQKLNEMPDNSAIKLSYLDTWRQRLNKNRPASTDRSQAAALDVLKGQFDRFLETKFNTDMIRGNPRAIEKWQEAREAFQQYKKTFDENRTIAQLARKDATPEEMRQWIFGASTTGAKKQAADTVRRLKEIVGEDSPQMKALRQDALIDIMEPLMREDPNLNAFVGNYDKFVRNNKSLANELFPDAEDNLKALRDFASAVKNRSPDSVKLDINRMGAVALFGHGIAKAALKVNIARSAFNMMRRSGDRSARKQIMGDVLGYDPYAPILPKSMAIIGGVTQSGMDTSQQDDQTPPQSLGGETTIRQ